MSEPKFDNDVGYDTSQLLYWVDGSMKKHVDGEPIRRNVPCADLSCEISQNRYGEFSLYGWVHTPWSQLPLGFRTVLTLLGSNRS